MEPKYITLTLVFIVQVTRISAHGDLGEECLTPYDVVGVCVERSRCHSPLDLFYFDFVIFKNNLCERSVRASNGRPFVCCTHPIIPPRPAIRPQIFPPIPPEATTFGVRRTTPLLAPQTLPQTTPSTTMPATTLPTDPQTSTDSILPTTTQSNTQAPTEPLPQTTTPTPTFQTPTEPNSPTTTPSNPQTTQTSNVPNPTNMSCFDPRGVEGFCCNLVDCPNVNIEYQTRKFFFTYNDEYRVYVQQSTSICITQSRDSVCCPNRRNATEAPPVTTTTTTTPAPEPNIPFGRLLSPLEGCGYSNVTHKTIADGNSAESGTFPWIALLGGYTNNSNELIWNCAGSLISSRHVLTAAHCVTPTLTTVRLGAYNISVTNEDAVQDVQLIAAERHIDYDERLGINDIAILYLERDVDATPEIRPICLPVNETLRSRSFVGYLPFVAGWDLAKADGNSSDVIRELQVPVLNNDECREQYQRQNKIVPESQFDANMICTGAYIGRYDNCVSDSGSPLMQPIYDRDTLDDRYYQIGIISSEIGCDQAETLDIYARVQTFVDWIQERVN